MSKKSKGVELDDISFVEFANFDDDKFSYYQRIGKAMKPDPAGLVDIYQWTFGKVKELQMMFTETVTIKRIPEILVFAHTTEKRTRKPELFWRMKWHKVFALWNHIHKQMDQINKREEVLKYEPDADEEGAGIDRFIKFGTLATIDLLADGNVLLYDQIEDQPYSLIFAKLLLEKEKGQYLKALHAIKNRPKP
jgi:hypothetical protein